jgi:acyl-CoA synthetase (AMP-forming)/AMP-acid ligase II
MDRTLIAIPLFHVSGLIGQFIHMMLVGGTSVLLREYSTREFLQTAVRNQITFMFNVPAIYNLLLMHKEEASQITTLRLALYGGAPMSADTIMRLKTLFPGLDLQNAYGATETSSPATLMPKDWEISKVLSVGRPVPGSTCKVIGEDGRECEPQEVGELWIHGAMVIPEYWENEAANRGSFEQGFWKSGDMAMIDKDGYVYIMDRKKDIINRGGEKIYSVEVENVLYSHPKILEAAVIGVPDEIFGEQVKAFVVPVESETITAEEVIEFVKSHLAHFKTPKYVEFLQGLPRNPGGKVMKHTLREGGSNG